MSDDDLKKHKNNAMIKYIENGFYLFSGLLTQDIHSFLIFLNQNLNKRFGELIPNQKSSKKMDPLFKKFLFYSCEKTNYTKNMLGFIEITHLKILSTPLYFLKIDSHMEEFLFENKIKRNDWFDLTSKELFPFRYIDQNIAKDRLNHSSIKKWLEYNLKTELKK